MKFFRLTVALGLVAALWMSAPSLNAQQVPAKPAAATGGGSESGTLMFEVTINRYQGEKRISSVPYSLAVRPGANRSTLRVGGQIPIPSTTFTPTKDAKEGAATPTAPMTSYSYRDIGTNIDVQSEAPIDGRYRILVTIDESSVYPPTEAAKNSIMLASAPAFRSLRASNLMTLKNGETIEFTAATDRITGETARVSVKLTIIN